MKLQSNNKKPLYTREGKTALICWDEKKQQVDNLDGTKVTLWNYSYVRVPFPVTYDSLVSAIVSSEYDEDRMQAVINNYLADTTDVEHLQEFQEMQAWRQEAKMVARRVINL